MVHRGEPVVHRQEVKILNDYRNANRENGSLKKTMRRGGILLQQIYRYSCKITSLLCYN